MHMQMSASTTPQHPNRETCSVAGNWTHKRALSRTRRCRWPRHLRVLHVAHGGARRPIQPSAPSVARPRCNASPVPADLSSTSRSKRFVIPSSNQERASPRCPVADEPLERTNCHVHHDGASTTAFHDLVQAFVREHKINLSRIEYLAGRVRCAVRSTLSMALMWCCSCHHGVRRNEPRMCLPRAHRCVRVIRQGQWIGAGGLGGQQQK